MPQMESLFKLLYTGITRSCNRLLFVETVEAAASHAFFRWLNKRGFAEPYDDKLSSSDGGLKAVYMSSDEWKLRGIEFVLSADRNSGRNLALFRNALNCFEKGGDVTKPLQDKIVVSIEAEELKDRLILCHNSTSADRPMIAHVVNVVKKCIQEGLLQEAYDICLLLRPLTAEEDSNTSRLYTQGIILPFQALVELKR